MSIVANFRDSFPVCDEESRIWGHKFEKDPKKATTSTGVARVAAPRRNIGPKLKHRPLFTLLFVIVLQSNIKSVLFVIVLQSNVKSVRTALVAILTSTIIVHHHGHYHHQLRCKTCVFGLPGGLASSAAVFNSLSNTSSLYSTPATTTRFLEFFFFFKSLESPRCRLYGKHGRWRTLRNGATAR